MKTSMSWCAVLPTAAGLLAAYVAPAKAQDAQQSRTPFQEAYEAGRQKYSPRWGNPFDYRGARADFRRALGLAATDNEKAEALLAFGRAFVADAEAADDAAARAELRAELAGILTSDALAPEQRAEAYLTTAEAYLGDMDYGRARDACDRARNAADDPLWASRTQMLLARSYLQERRYPAAQGEIRRLLEREGLGEQLRWEAEALLGAIDLLPRIRPEHPRLFLSADVWPAARARALTVEKPLFDQMVAGVNALPVEQIQSGNFALQAMQAAFVYRVTGDQAVLRKVRRMLRVTADFFVTVFHERRDGLSDAARSRVAWAAALDWVWDDLPAPERDALANAMVRHTSEVVSERRVAGRLAIWPHYYVGSMLWYAAIALLDPAADDVAYARVVSFLGIGFRNHQERLNDLVRSAGGQGVWQTNIEYDFTAVPVPIIAFLHSWEPATGSEIPKDWGDVIISPEFVLRMVVGFGPGHVIKHFNYAGHSGGVWGFGRTSCDPLYDTLGEYVNFFGQSHPQEAAIARWFRRRMVEGGAGPSENEYPVFRFLAPGLDKAPPAVLPPGLPLARHFASVGLVLMSSGFGSDDTYALFSQGGGVVGRRHDHDATHFAIYKKGYLALDSGARNAVLHSFNYRHQTVAHNAVLIQMPGEQFPKSVSGPVIANTGGQNRYPEYARALAFETDRRYAYTATDATSVYNEAKCAQMVRQFLYLPPDHFVVFDRVVSTKGEYAKAWLLHTGNEPVIAGKEFRSDQDQGRLFCRTLYPLDAVLEKIGGPGREFWADGRNWPVEEWGEGGSRDWWEHTQRYMTRYADGRTDPREAMGRWRVEVTPGAARTEDCFLHLIQASDQTVQKMAESQVRDRGNQVELTFAVGARTYTIALNKTGAVGGHIRIEEGGKSVVDKDLTREVQRQEGLALSR
ncbi:MAG: hypothetical protein HY321_10450 [Armatimonadetes bacterium]|nr:hypothetical protein [Armatimonadota bacterium]